MRPERMALGRAGMIEVVAGSCVIPSFSITRREGRFAGTVKAVEVGSYEEWRDSDHRPLTAELLKRVAGT